MCLFRKTFFHVTITSGFTSLTPAHSENSVSTADTHPGGKKMTWNLLLISSVILLCIVLHRISQYVAYHAAGLYPSRYGFGTDGIVKISFDNYPLAENICSTALILFIMFYGGFGTNWNEARPVAVKSVFLSTLGVVINHRPHRFLLLFCPEIQLSGQHADRLCHQLHGRGLCLLHTPF